LRVSKTLECETASHFALSGNREAEGGGCFAQLIKGETNESTATEHLRFSLDYWRRTIAIATSKHNLASIYPPPSRED
jgi:hypothetical protein